jgi:hypothetical protein
MWARIDNGVVAELTNIDPAGRFHPSMVWMACSGAVQLGWVLVNNQLKESSELLSALHARKQMEIDRGCESVITAGFWSSALGEPHRYSSQIHDQLNLIEAVLSGQGMGHPCRDAGGARQFPMHTSAQLHAVNNDLSAYKLQFLQQAHLLKLQLDRALAANDRAALEAVVWEVSP